MGLALCNLRLGLFLANFAVGYMAANAPVSTTIDNMLKDPGIEKGCLDFTLDDVVVSSEISSGVKILRISDSIETAAI